MNAKARKTINLVSFAGALALFFLPWIQIRCNLQTLVSQSGAQIATGGVSVHAAFDNKNERRIESRNSPSDVIARFESLDFEHLELEVPAPGSSDAKEMRVPGNPSSGRAPDVDAPPASNLMLLYIALVAGGLLLAVLSAPISRLSGKVTTLVGPLALGTLITQYAVGIPANRMLTDAMRQQGTDRAGEVIAASMIACELTPYYYASVVLVAIVSVLALHGFVAANKDG